jgi:hypothetical protein
MRKLIAVLTLLSLASWAWAGTYQITTMAAQDARLSRHVTRLNKATCTSLGLPASCTQAKARQVDPEAVVYAGVEDYLQRAVVRAHLVDLRERDRADDQAEWCAWWRGASAEAQASACAQAGLPSGCELCR